MLKKPIIGVDVGGRNIGTGRLELNSVVEHQTNKITSGTVEQTVNEINPLRKYMIPMCRYRCRWHNGRSLWTWTEQ